MEAAITLIPQQFLFVFYGGRVQLHLGSSISIQMEGLAGPVGSAAGTGVSAQLYTDDRPGEMPCALYTRGPTSELGPWGNPYLR